VAERVAVCVAALLGRRDGAAELGREAAMSSIYGSSITGTLATGSDAGRRVQTIGEFQSEGISVERVEHSGSCCAMGSGFSVHAGVSIRADDRKGLERLCKYVARPPIVADRLTQLPDGRLCYRLKTPWRNGATHVIFEPMEFMARLSAIIPAPRKNLIHFYGVLGPAAKWRASIVPAPSEVDPATESCGCEGDQTAKKGPSSKLCLVLTHGSGFRI
jgi:hypothetical protein